MTDFLDSYQMEDLPDNLIQEAQHYGKLKHRPGVVERENRDRLSLVQFLDETYPEVIYWFDLAGEAESTVVKAATLKCKNGFKVHDLIIDFPKAPFNGLRLELKRSNFKLFKKNGDLYEQEHIELQYKSIQRTRSMGYYADFASGFDDAKTKIVNYLYGFHEKNQIISIAPLV